MLAPRTQIGPYTIQSLLGQGGMSNLYLARDDRPNRNGTIVVIKEMTASYADPKEQQMANDLFMREAQLLASLNHPNIPKVTDRFKYQGKFYLNMEYVQGKDMGQLITQAGRPLEEKDVAHWGHQMATVLYYLHRQSPPIVFRDVKPSNIMIAGDQVKLIDFGIARLFTPAKKGDTMLIGSPGYAPPEQYSGQTDPRSDIYALGVTLHHALTGHDPTVSQTPFLIPAAKSLNPRLSDEMVNVINRATQLDPDKRYPSMIEMKRDLQVVLRKHGINVGASVPLQPLSAPAVSSSPVAGQTPSPVLAPLAGVAAAAPAQAGAPLSQPPSAAYTPSTPPATAAGRTQGRPWAALIFVAFSLGATVFLAPRTLPAPWKAAINSAYKGIVSTAMPNPTLPADAAQAAGLLYRKNGQLSIVLELAQRAVEEQPADPERRILYQNALALNCQLPVARWAVAVPGNDSRMELLKGLAVAQKVLNDRGGVEQSLVVVEIGTYDVKDPSSAYQEALRGQWGRPKASALQGVLVFAEQDFRWTELLAGSTVPTYVVGPLAGAVPSGLQTLSLPEKSLSELFKSAFGADPGKILWLAQKTKLDGTVPGTVEAKVVATLKEKGCKLVVIDADQAKLVAELKLPSEVRVVLVAERMDQLPPVAELGGLKPSSLVAGSRFSSGELQSAFFRVGTAMFSDWKPAPRSPGGTGYDGLLWAVQPGGARWVGARVKADSQGKIGPAPWGLAEIRNDKWTFVRNVE